MQRLKNVMIITVLFIIIITTIPTSFAISIFVMIFYRVQFFFTGIHVKGPEY